MVSRFVTLAFLALVPSEVMGGMGLTGVSVGVGHATNDFHYLTFGDGTSYDFGGSYPVFLLKNGIFDFDMGWGKETFAPGVPPLELLEARLAVTPKLMSRDFGSTEDFVLAGVLRCGLDYRSIRGISEEAPVADVVQVGMAIGPGLLIAASREPLGSVTVAMSTSLGVLLDVETSDGNHDRVLGERRLEVTAFPSVARFGNVQLRMTYAFSMERWPDEDSPKGEGDVWEALWPWSDLPKRRGQSRFELGVAW